tara:strand:- start:266 stop:613 length:348 start_codon:yes stop_codon:yes gene_type:complete
MGLEKVMSKLLTGLVSSAIFLGSYSCAGTAGINYYASSEVKEIRCSFKKLGDLRVPVRYCDVTFGEEEITGRFYDTDSIDGVIEKGDLVNVSLARSFVGIDIYSGERISKAPDSE